MLTIDETRGQVTVSRPDGTQDVLPMASPEAFEAVSGAWLRCGWDVKYVYGFTWMGRPIIQLPEDMIRTTFNRSYAITAALEVPKDGVASTVTAEQLAANLDPKGK